LQARIKVLVLLVVGGVIALAIVPALPGNLREWISDKQETVEQKSEEIVGAVEDYRESIDNLIEAANAIEQAGAATESLAAPADAEAESETQVSSPTSVPEKTTLTERGIFILESQGEITPEVAVLMLSLVKRGFSPTIDEPGIVTVTDVAPTQDVCVVVGCDGGIIPDARLGDITLIMKVEPIALVEDRGYTVWLADLGGATLDAESLRWTSGQLEQPAANERSRSAIAEAEKGRVKLVALRIPFDDISVPAFVDDYNQEFKNGLAQYEKGIIDECRITIEANSSPRIGNPECLDRTFLPYRLDSDSFAAVLARHYLIELMPEREF
jgi:hypothetical protein